MTIVNALPFTLQNGTTADATQVMANFDEIANDVNNNAAHNGVNSDIMALTGLTTPITPAQGGTPVFIGGTSGGATNVQTLANPSPNGFSLAAGNRVTFIAGFTNTGVLTLNVNSLGATAVLKPSPAGPVALAGGEVTATNEVEVIFDGTQFILFTKAYFDGGIGARTSIASATTTDLGTIPSHYALVTLSASPITSFGSSASTTFPVYYLSFQAGITITHNIASLILPGLQDIVTSAGDFAIALYTGAGAWIVLNYSRRSGQPVAFSANFLQGYINGLTLSTAGSSGTMSIAAGEATDSTNAQVIIGAASSKTTASWAVGSGNGGLDTGAIATGTWYHFFTIYRPDTGVTDYLFSLSATAPTLPANYTLFRRIGAGKTDGSSQWTLFTQTGDTFVWSVVVNDLNAGTSTARANVTLTVPPGVVVAANFRAALSASVGASAAIFTSLQESDQAPVVGRLSDLSTSGATTAAGDFQRLTDTSARIAYRNDTATLSTYIYTYGWVDRRGKS